jgi:hypothetical protein
VRRRRFFFQDKKRWKKEKNTKIYASLTKFSVFIIESKANWGRRRGGMNIQKEALITMSFSITFLFRFGNDDEGEALSKKIRGLSRILCEAMICFTQFFNLIHH